GAGLQRWLEGALPPGDVLARWLALSCAVSLAAGAIAGLLLSPRALGRIGWAAWGAASPLAVALLVLGTAAAVRPLRDAWAARREANCRAAGRATCTLREFLARCGSAGRGDAAA